MNRRKFIATAAAAAAGVTAAKGTLAAELPQSKVPTGLQFQKHEFSGCDWHLPHFAMTQEQWDEVNELAKKTGYATTSKSRCDCGYVFAGPHGDSIGELYFDKKDDNMNSHPPHREAVANSYLVCASPKLLLAAEAVLKAADMEVQRSTLQRRQATNEALLQLYTAVKSSFPPPEQQPAAGAAA